MACTCCFTVGLYQVYGNPFFSEIMKKIIEKFKLISIENSDNLKENIFKLKNISLIFSYFYLFDSITLDFVFEFITSLLQKIDNDMIEILLTIIQNTGLKIRKDNPKLLKDMIDQIKTAFDRYKNENSIQGFEKGDFLLMILNDIKLNKNIKNNPFETLSFLLSWSKKNVLQKMKLVPKIFSLDFNKLLEADFTRRQWWDRINNLSQENQDKSNNEENYEISNEKREYLEKLASEQKFVTMIRKKIFMAVMSAEDYLDALQGILKLKINKKQNMDVAVVLVECCAQEQTFNKFYFFLVEKLIELKKEMKFCVQYAFWDHFKLLENYELRKICNLAKFCGLLVNKKILGLNVLKGMDLDQNNEHHFLFMKTFLKSFFEKFFFSLFI